MTTSSLPAVIGLGELLWDDFPDGRRPGGAPANVAFQANQLGFRGLMATRIGADPAGDDLLQELSAKNLDFSLVQRDPKYSTGRVTVELNAGIPNYQIHENVAWDFLELTPSLQNAIKSAAAVCFGTLAQRNAASRETIHAALHLAPTSCLRVYDVNLRQNYFDRSWIEESLQLASVVKLNDEEVPILASLLELSTDEADFARQLIEKFSLQLVCVTRGAKGCLIVSKVEIHEIPGRPVKVADTVGAGDAFTAGLIASLLRGWPLALAGEFANRVGGLVASRQGAMPELHEEFVDLIKQYSS